MLLREPTERAPDTPLFSSAVTSASDFFKRTFG
jgi:hypothetical protein